MFEYLWEVFEYLKDKTIPGSDQHPWREGGVWDRPDVHRSVLNISVPDDKWHAEQWLSGTPNLTRPLPSPNQDNIVLEFKALEASRDQLAEIVQRLPVRVTRNSKYVNGMLQANAH